MKEVWKHGVLERSLSSAGSGTCGSRETLIELLYEKGTR